MSVFNEVFPKAGGKAKFEQNSKDEYRGGVATAGMPSNAQEELYQNMFFMHCYGYYGKANVNESH